MIAGHFSIVPCGDDALRIRTGGGAVRHHLAAELRQRGGWIDIVPGTEDLTVAFDPHLEGIEEAASRLAAELQNASRMPEMTQRFIALEARFGGTDGPDLAGLAAANQMSEAACVAAILASKLMVDMLGFTPGFAYVAGVEPRLQAARLAHPRARVPAGSIGLITGQLGIYALDGPGGWPIIGRLTAPIFRKTLADPFLLQPGDALLISQQGRAP